MATINTDTAKDINGDATKSTTGAMVLTWQWATWPLALRRAVIVFFSFLVGLVALVGAVMWADDYFSAELKKQNKLKQQAQDQLRNSGKERMDIEANLPLLNELEADNVFGEEKRLEWVELLRTLEKRWPGTSIRYEIAAQNLLPPKAKAGMLSAIASTQLLPSGEAAKSFGVFTTVMSLNFRVLHEGDVLAILSELKAEKLGRFDVTRCSFRRISGSDFATRLPNGVPVAGMNADCELVWVSMKSYTP